MGTDRPGRNGRLNDNSNGDLNSSADGMRARHRSQADTRASRHASRGDAEDATHRARQDAGEITSLSLEATLDELDRITAALEESHRPLEESLTLYERGVRLVQHSQELLDSADLRLQRLRPTSQDDGDDARSGFALDDFELDDE